HTWAKIEDGKARIGITDYAQESLGDIVYVELPEVDSEVEAGDKIGDIESTKATSDVISPVTGTVLEVNEELVDAPEIINEDPYEKGWIALIKLSEEPKDLMEVGDYEKYIEEEAK
ncbi:MAG: glycine cleavage system protein GcvH, partial [Nitrospirae bacterium]